MKRTSLISFSCIAGLAALAACSSSGSDVKSDESKATEAQLNALFDVNDVSILFPIVTSDGGGQSGSDGGVAGSDGGVAGSDGGVAGSDGGVAGSNGVAGFGSGGGVAGFGSGGGPGGPSSARAFPDIEMSESLWKATHHQQVMAKASEIGITTLPALGSFRPVGVRFDPCAPGFTQEARDAQPGPAKGLCLIQFRLIVQPIDASDRLGSQDVAAHLVFTLGASPIEQLAQNPIVLNATRLLENVKNESKRAGADTAGKALGVHPGLATGDAGVANAVKELVTACTERACGDAPAPANRSIAFMGLKGIPEPWTFLAGQVNPADDTWTNVPAPRLQGATSQDLDFITGRGPVTPRPDGATQGTFVERSTTPLLDGDRSTRARTAAFQVENAKDTHFFNADCVSCHTLSSQITGSGIGGFLKDDGTLDPQGAEELKARMEVPKGITGYVARNDTQTFVYNTRNFGYFGSAPTVSTRTVTETVEVVDFLNTKVKPTPTSADDPTLLHGPGPDCSGTDANGVPVDVKVFLCMRDGKTDCFSVCKPAPAPEPAPAPAN
jgi:hypothetical protein